jgi:GNAT superfamily N-acetyltransferase
MAQSWSIRAYQKGDERGILSLMKLSGFGRPNEQTEEYWTWKHSSNPLGHITGVAESSGQIVGHCAFLPVRMKVGDDVILASQVTDFLVHPEFRRQGISLALRRFLLNRAADEGISIAFSFPNKRERSAQLKIGAHFEICKVPRLINSLNLGKTVVQKTRTLAKLAVSNRTLRDLPGATIFLVTGLQRGFNRTAADCGENVEIYPVQRFDDRIDAFWERACKDYTIAVVRTREYLNWRYFARSGSEYTVFLAQKNNEISGYAVLASQDQQGLKVGNIVDIFASPKDDATIQCLVLKAIDYFRERNADLIMCWMLQRSSSARPYYESLGCNGFMPLLGNSMPLTAAFVELDLPRALQDFVKDQTQWYITKGDSDQV